MRDESALADVVVGGDEARATLRPERAAELCRGHFPGNPIVPGALLVGVMAELASRLAAGADRAPLAIVRATFLRSVHPDGVTTLAATRDGERITVEVRAAGAVAARATFRFGDPA